MKYYLFNLKFIFLYAKIKIIVVFFIHVNTFFKIRKL